MFAKLNLRLRDILSSTDATSMLPPPQGEFVKGINLGGDRVAIEGHIWESYQDALVGGLSIPGAESLTTNVLPQPYVKPGVRQMLNTVVYKPETLEIIQPLPNGTYQIYLWMMENYASDWHSLEVRLGNEVVATGIGQLALGQWSRYGAYITTVTDGCLQVAISTHNPKIDAHVMGISIFK